MSRKCPNCGSSEIDDDSARGDSTCMGCGTVLEESTIVSDVAFQENAGGGHSLVGKFLLTGYLCRFETLYCMQKR